MKWLSVLPAIVLAGCSGMKPQNLNPIPEPMPQTIFPVVTATISVGSIGDLAKLKKTVPEKLFNSIIPTAIAQVQANGVVSVVYTNPGAQSFTLNTSGFMAGAFPSVSGDNLNMGSIAISALDDNSLRVCTGVGSPGNRCNRAYIRVFTLGSNISGSITGIQGFINVDATPAYGIDVLAGSITTPIGWNANAMAASVTDAASVFTYTIPGNMNRLRLTDTGAITFPVKADLYNAGSGQYEMRLVVQYALGYVP